MGTGRHQPSPQEGDSQAKVQPEQDTGVPAGLGQQRHPTEWSFRAAAEMCWVEEGDSTLVPGLPGSLQDLAPPTPSTLVRPLERRKLLGCLAFALRGKGKGPANSRPSSWIVPGGVESLCLKQQPRLGKQSIPKQTKCAQLTRVQCWLDPLP
ncbi:hypothetical protein NDU88_006182 [Pleurodeles waltl]|uniref:Uncharacterized protein n=1 Tax=Pleurodeles waltl TaxID=8319 RepID=A0AAV7LW67_PLEWA|nr:hypothetical protein NDU88_006182 [Pleurodeles waltl]